MKLGGEERVLTVMFCDLRSFTTLSEGLTAVELTHFLNDYLTPMTDAVLDASGTVDKYIGDAIMAFWNAPLDDPDHARNAVEAALKMRALLASLNVRWRAEAAAKGRRFTQVKFGIGLNTGECCVGNLGSTRRFDYSAIGDEVNVASRLEGASKQFGVDIVASESTRALTPDYAWLEIDQVLLKNKTRPVGVFALAGGRDLRQERELSLRWRASMPRCSPPIGARPSLRPRRPQRRRWRWRRRNSRALPIQRGALRAPRPQRTAQRMAAARGARGKVSHPPLARRRGYGLRAAKMPDPR